MRDVSRILALSLYAAITLGGAGLHLLEFAPEADCAACEGDPHGDVVHAPCSDGPLPCQQPSHSHHSHPVHQHEDGCVTCTILSSQHADAPAPLDLGVVQAVRIAPPATTAVPTRPGVPRPPDRAPPGA